MSQIKLTLSGQVLSLSQTTIVGDSLNFITAEIVKKSSTWDGLTLWLSISKGNANYIVAFENDILTEHLNLASGSYSVSVYGELTANGNVVKRVTSSVTSLTVQPSGVIDGEPLPVTPPSVGEQILAVAQNALSVSNGVRADADAHQSIQLQVNAAIAAVTSQLAEITSTLTIENETWEVE